MWYYLVVLKCELRTDVRWQMLACSCDCNLVVKVPSYFGDRQLNTCVLTTSDQMLLREWLFKLTMTTKESWWWSL